MIFVSCTVNSCDFTVHALKKKKKKTLNANAQSKQVLSRLTILLIEKKMLEELKYKNLISNFISQKARKIDFK